MKYNTDIHNKRATNSLDILLMCKSGSRGKSRTGMAFVWKAILLVAFLGLLQKQHYSVVAYVSPCSHQTTTKCSPSLLRSSPNVFSGSMTASRGDDDDETNNRTKQKKDDPKRIIKYSDFWGTKYSTEDEDSASNNPRRIPLVPTLDPNDGPLPPGAYIVEGKPELDAKTTCRISIAVKAGGSKDIMDDPDMVVRRLQACVDAGLDTFQLHDQTPGSLGIVRKMNEDTPSYVQKHWSICFRVPRISPEYGGISPKSDLRHSILDLIEQTGSDSLDSLQVDCSDLPASSHETTLEVLEHLIDLQEEGWIRSIGLRDVETLQLQQDIHMYFGDNIDFEQQEGSLLVQPPTSKLWVPSKKVRMSNALAGDLLTDRYYNNRHQDKGTSRSNHSRNPLPNLSRADMTILNEWVSRREKQRSVSPWKTWNEYQDHVVEQISWIAMKHDVSMTAVALRWALESGGSMYSDKDDGPIVSTAIANVVLDGPSDLPFQTPRALRQVFRFQLDEEDKDILSAIAAFERGKKDKKTVDDGYGFQLDDEDDDEYPEIDFNNPVLYL